jgi:hypothetical protein
VALMKERKAVLVLSGAKEAAPSPRLAGALTPTATLREGHD